MKEALSPTSSDLSSETSESNFKMDLTLNKSMIEEDIYAVFINNPDMNDKNEKNKIQTSKYKWFNFLAKILMEQFSRLANAYFLVIAVLQSIKELSYSGGTPIMLLPLSFVVSLNGLKDMYEDFKRKKSDKKENNSECLIYNPMNHNFEKRKWHEIKLGDIIKVENNQQFPADLLLLSTSDENGISYVETKNLDGEINLKFKQANKSIHDIIYKQGEAKLNNLKYVCVTKPPNEFIYKFDATLYPTEIDGSLLDRNQFHLFDNSSFLLRGCTLRQTEYIIGATIYVGHNTKSLINSPDLRAKHSSVEIEMNKHLIAIFLTQIILSSILSIVYVIIYSKNFYGLWQYFFDKEVNEVDNQFMELFLKMAGTWVVINTNFVPISLLVTMETIKFFQAMFMEWDIDMFDRETSIGCKVQSSTLNEELGQIKYIFSDKTGTLTKNYMKYKMMSIGDNIYGNYNKSKKNKIKEIDIKEENNDITVNLINNENEKKELINDINDDDNILTDKENKLKDKYGEIENVEFIDINNIFASDIKNNEKKYLISEFLLCLSLCHTVLIDNKKRKEKGLLEYQCSSPDEKALVYFARSQGYILKNKSLDNIITLEISGKEKKFELLNTLEYTSERKRMSVIVKTEDNKYMVYAKGADSMIELLLCNEDKNSQILNKTKEYLKLFSVNGLRTLMIAYKEIPEDYYQKWNEEYKKIKTNVNHTEEDLYKLYNEMEKNFKLIGSTAIEDELQDNVGEIINDIMITGIRVWMLTGDKLDTAKNIAISCKLFKEDMKIMEIKEHATVEGLKSQLKVMLNDNVFKDDLINVGLLIGGEELEKIFADNELLNLFFELSVNCLSVVCSRVSPKQKGQLVNLIKSTERAVTLAIGDGANDVGMINEANVGVGIQGKEGSQAARASDYAIKEFSHLKKLLFFHGRECYRKNSWVILYNFYKNVLFVSPMICTAFVSFFSGMTTYDPFVHQLMNTIYTAVPPGWYGVFNYEYTPTELMNNPRYYIQGICKKLYHFKGLIRSFTLSALEGLIIFLCCHYWYRFGNHDGTTNDYWSVGTVMMAAVVIQANLKLALDMSFYDYFSIIIIILSILLYLFTIAIANSDWMLPEGIVTQFYILDNFIEVIIDLKFLFCMILVCTFCCFIEIFANKVFILYGIVVDGKLLPPYKRIKNKKQILNLEMDEEKQDEFEIKEI
jgi:phospholipid-transporting ATPase